MIAKQTRVQIIRPGVTLINDEVPSSIGLLHQHEGEQAAEQAVEHDRLGEREAEGILAEARRISEAQRERVREETEADRQRRLEETKRQIEAETQRALDQIRAEVAELTLIATSKVTGKVLDRDDHRKLIEDAIGELDFSVLERQRV